MRWTLKRTQWGWSLCFDGELVSSADDPRDLFRYQASLTSAALYN
jgi:hypothetical protein